MPKSAAKKKVSGAVSPYAFYPKIILEDNLKGPAGDMIAVYRISLLKPNRECFPPAVMHTLKHCLDKYLCEQLSDTIHLAPMGCRTGFKLLTWGELPIEEIDSAFCRALNKVLKTEWGEIPEVNESNCNNCRDHSLYGAKKYAKQILEGMLNTLPYKDDGPL